MENRTTAAFNLSIHTNVYLVLACPASAVVMQLGGSRFLDCYIPALGCDVRIHTNSLLAGGDAAISATWRPESKCADHMLPSVRALCMGSATAGVQS
jgi:hypothetical protein